MDTQQALRFQQAEFFLLYNLVVEELRLLRRTKRIAPSAARDVNSGTASLTRLFRSFLTKVLPPPMTISKRPYRLEFGIGIDGPTQKLLQAAKDLDECQALRAPAPEEIGLLRFSFPSHLAITLSGHRFRRSRWYQSTWGASELGITRFCDAVKVIMSWKGRFDRAVAAATAGDPR